MEPKAPRDAEPKEHKELGEKIAFTTDLSLVQEICSEQPKLRFDVKIIASVLPFEYNPVYYEYAAFPNIEEIHDYIRINESHLYSAVDRLIELSSLRLLRLTFVPRKRHSRLIDDVRGDVIPHMIHRLGKRIGHMDIKIEVRGSEETFSLTNGHLHVLPAITPADIPILDTMMDKQCLHGVVLNGYVDFIPRVMINHITIHDWFLYGPLSLQLFLKRGLKVTFQLDQRDLSHTISELVSIIIGASSYHLSSLLVPLPVQSLDAVLASHSSLTEIGVAALKDEDVEAIQSWSKSHPTIELVVYYDRRLKIGSVLTGKVQLVDIARAFTLAL